MGDDHWKEAALDARAVLRLMEADNVRLRAALKRAIEYADLYSYYHEGKQCKSLDDIRHLVQEEK